MEIYGIFIILFVFLNFCDASRILFIASTPSYSHQIIYQPIWIELSLRGHQVTVITVYPLDDPKLSNLTEINLNYIYNLREEKYKFSEKVNTLKDEQWKFAAFVQSFLGSVDDDELSDPKVKRLIQDQNAKFDLVIFEFMLPTMVAFGHRFNCPVIAIISLDGSLVKHDLMGNPTHPALNPDYILNFNLKLTFMQRFISTIYSALSRLAFVFIKREQDKVIGKHFGADYPPLDELLANIDMFFMNVNPAFHNIRPTVPTVINIGGSMHIKEPKPLPQDLKILLDNAENGVIYISFGTNILIKYLDQRLVSEILQAISELPYQFMWKSDIVFHEKPNNLLLITWVPQQDVLRHPKVKVFITQGGLQSIMEAILFKKPVICLPFIADQFSNCIQAHNKGMGVTLDRQNLNSQLIKNAILDTAENQTYLDSVTKLSIIAEDQPMTGLEKAVWWTEYVLRHQGAKHLRYGAADMPLYQYFLIDVLATIAAILFITSYILLKLTTLIINTLCRYFKYKKVESTKKEN